MKRQQALRHRLQTLATLRDAVGAMRSLAAHHFRRARQALAPARQYREEMDTVIAEIGIHQPLQAAPTGLLVVASDLGLCGDYNSRISRCAVEEARRHGAHSIYSVGRRARPAMARDSLSPVRTYAAPASVEGISRLLLELAGDILEDYLAKKIGGLQVVSANFGGVGHFTPLAARVLPIEPAAATRPLRHSPFIDAGHLRMVAVREFLYITLYGILLDALAAEHGMRLMAAESALQWLDKTSETASRRLANSRSEAATQELLDIVSGGRQRLRVKPD